MTIDPRFGMWFSIVAAIVSALGVCGTQFTTLFGEATSGKILAVIVVLNVINSAVNAVLHMIPSKPGSATEFALGPKAVVLLAILILGTLAFPGDARAQLKPLTGNIRNDLGIASKPIASAPAGSVDGAVQSFGEGIQKIEKALVDKGIADLTAAISDATNHNDNISLPCWQANLKLLQSLPSQWETPPSPIGIALGIQIQRDLLNAITGNDKDSLKVACAALWGDQLKIVANLGALIGVRIATGGLF